jgi:hypothetical protein
MAVVLCGVGVLLVTLLQHFNYLGTGGRLRHVSIGCAAASAGFYFLGVICYAAIRPAFNDTVRTLSAWRLNF